jgi:hypothetical protein
MMTITNANNNEHQQLPDLLKRTIDLGESQREKDLILLGTLALISGCLQKAHGYYKKRKVHANLYLFVVGPAAGGKGILTFVKKLAEPYHKKIIAEARTNGKVQMLFVPANSSAAAFFDSLQSNNGSGIIFETEADTLSMAIAKEWGDYSDVLRKAFHHEAVTQNRLGDPKLSQRKLLEIDQPQVSAVISGTPDQVKPVVESSINGLFSRFMFYVFDGEERWADVSPGAEGWNLDDAFTSLSEEYHELIKYNAVNPFVFNLTTDQWRALNEHFKVILEDQRHAGLSGTIKRLGLITFRLCMIMTAFRRFQQANAETSVCTEEDFTFCLDLSVELFKDAAKLAKVAHAPSVIKPSKKLLLALPSEFLRAQAQEIGKSIGFGEHSIDIYLKEEVDAGCLNRIKAGFYRKT